MRIKAKTMWWVGGFVAFIAILLVIGRFTTPVFVKTITDPNTIPSIVENKGPWNTNGRGLLARLKYIGLLPLSREGTSLHIHEHVGISINGKTIKVPAEIGVNRISGFMSSIHTHEQNGIVHIESPVMRTFTLGQFFDVWGVRFSADCIGGYCADKDSSVKVYVDGKKYDGNPRVIPLKERSNIFITYENNASTTQPVSYKFPIRD